MKLETDLNRSAAAPADGSDGKPAGCEERDRIILSYLMVIGRQNGALRRAESAVTPEEKAEAQSEIEGARNDSSRIRQLLMDHCQRHGC